MKYNMNTSARDNRAIPLDCQVTFCRCEKCGEGYEAAYDHVCMKKNSYPMFEKEDEMKRRT